MACKAGWLGSSGTRARHDLRGANENELPLVPLPVSSRLPPRPSVEEGKERENQAAALPAFRIKIRAGSPVS